MEIREQRVRFVAALRRKRSLSSLCREFGISRPTGRLWLNRYQALGMQVPASRWRPSPRRYVPRQPLWQFPRDLVAEGRLLGQAGYPEQQVAHRSRSGRRMG